VSEGKDLVTEEEAKNVSLFAQYVLGVEPTRSPTESGSSHLGRKSLTRPVDGQWVVDLEGFVKIRLSIQFLLNETFTPQTVLNLMF
jgi:hypothetical protein